jgi:hypothetical protein
VVEQHRGEPPFPREPFRNQYALNNNVQQSWGAPVMSHQSQEETQQIYSLYSGSYGGFVTGYGQGVEKNQHAPLFKSTPAPVLSIEVTGLAARLPRRVRIAKGRLPNSSIGRSWGDANRTLRPQARTAECRAPFAAVGHTWKSAAAPS